LESVAITADSAWGACETDHDRRYYGNEKVNVAPHREGSDLERSQDRLSRIGSQGRNSRRAPPLLYLKSGTTRGRLQLD
jgi:hypothetical protein